MSLAIAGRDGAIQIVNLRTGSVGMTLAHVASTNGSGGAINGVQFSPDGRSIATAGDDCMVFLWSSETGRQRPISPLASHKEKVPKLNPKP